MSAVAGIVCTHCGEAAGSAALPDHWIALPEAQEDDPISYVASDGTPYSTPYAVGQGKAQKRMQAYLCPICLDIFFPFLAGGDLIDIPEATMMMHGSLSKEDVRSACVRGDIPGARRLGAAEEWFFPTAGLTDWLTKRKLVPGS